MAPQKPPAGSGPYETSAGFPLASLALLVTAFASLLACVDIDRWRQQVAALSVAGPWQLALVFGGAGVFGGIVGLIFALFRRSSWRTKLAAPFVGIVAGEIGISILVAPGAVWRTIIAVGVLLGTVILVRLDAD
jgi:hypothetical protein